jgi:hypothetical protein
MSWFKYRPAFKHEPTDPLFHDVAGRGWKEFLILAVERTVTAVVILCIAVGLLIALTRL